jgi:flagellar hook-associated protein 1 FlgK
MPTLFSGINLALQALLSHQASIQVVEHNVANANTPGYRRQEAILAAGPEFPPLGLQRALMAGQFGSGVQLQQVRRFNLEFFDGRYRRELAEASRWTLARDGLRQVEATLAETGEDGLTAKLDAFWAGWQAISADPTNLGPRLELLQRATDLVAGLNERAGRLQALQASQDGAILQKVDRINSLAGQVAELNAEITGVLAAGDQPNDLLDHRDRLLDELSVLAGATATVQENGGALVSIGGHVLVAGNSTFSLETSPDPDNGNLVQIKWDDGRDLSTGRGELAALLAMRDVHIEAQLDGLDQVAAALINQVNVLHRAGFGINNATGLDFFTGSDAQSIRLDIALDRPEDIASAAAADNPGDGSVAGQLAALQSALLAGGGTQTLSQFYTGQVTSLGLNIRQAAADADARSLVAENLNAQREAVSGVSLDEEAANLVKSQRAYEAAARLLTTLDDMVDRIINGLGRAGL